MEKKRTLFFYNSINDYNRLFLEKTNIQHGGVSRIDKILFRNRYRVLRIVQESREIGKTPYGKFQKSRKGMASPELSHFTLDAPSHFTYF